MKHDNFNASHQQATTQGHHEAETNNDGSFYLLAVGKVTEAAAQEIEQIGGRVLHLSSAPPVQLVSIPRPIFEYTDFCWSIRVRTGHMSLLWRGDHRGPQLTTLEQTMLVSEYNERPVQALASSEDFGDLDSCIF